MKTLIVYHANCIDGITAAAVVFKYLTEKREVDKEDITLYPMGYNDDTEELHLALIDQEIKSLYIVDFYFSVKDLLNLYAHETIKEIHLYDHHATAFRKLLGADYPLTKTSHENFYLSDEHRDPTNIHIVLDNNESGASLCWKWLMQAPDTFDDAAERKLPQLIKYVKDYDLWRFKYPNTKAVNKYLKLQNKNLAFYLDLLTVMDKFKFEVIIINKGELLLQYEDKLEDDLISQGVTPITINGIQGLCCNAPYAFASNIGYKLALESKTFGATWRQLAEGKVAFSLRSNGLQLDATDISALAEVMGGGGHKNASGFSFLSPAYDKNKGITIWSGSTYPDMAMAEQEHEIVEEDEEEEEDGATNG